MSLLFPGMAGFLVAAAIPLALYLIFRYRRRDVPWAAIYILRQTLQQKSKQNVWKQYTIIALRTLAFIALPLLFMGLAARRQLPPPGAFPAARPSTQRIILLDASASMTARWRGGSCFDHALSICRSLVGSASSPGETIVLPLRAAADPVRVPARTSQHELEVLLSEVVVSDAPADFVAGLRRALALFQLSPYEHRELYLLSDFSASDLASAKDLAVAVERLTKMRVSITCLTYENTAAENFALLDLTPGFDLLLAGQPTLFYARLAYYGQRQSAETWLTIEDGRGETLFAETITLTQGVKVLPIPLTLVGGEQTLTASLKDDDLGLDNRIRRSYRVNDELRLALIQDINLAAGFENPREWLQVALGQAPGERKVSDKFFTAGSEPASSAAPASHFRLVPTNFITSQLSAEGLVNQHGVVLIDVPTLPPDVQLVLRDYMMRGGVVLLAPGPKADAQRFNESFAGLAPARLESPPITTIDPDVYRNAVVAKPDDLLLRELESADHGNIGTCRFYSSYRIAENGLADDAEVLLTLGGADPLLLRRPVGRGQCLLWTAGLGGDWHSMVVHPVYPVFFIRLFNRAAAQQQFDLNLNAGDPLIREVEWLTGSLQLPDGSLRSLTSQAIGEGRWIRFDDTSQSGTYLLLGADTSPEHALRFQVRADHHESDYRAIDGDRRQAVEALLGHLHADEREVVESVNRQYGGRLLTTQLAIALLLLLVLESGLARRWFG